MLSLYHANDLESLGALAAQLLAQPQRDPLAPVQVVVPSQGMGRWLTLELARRQGIVMQLEVQLPASFIWQLTRQLLGELPEQSAFKPQTLTWRLYDWLFEAENLDRAPRLAHYLEGGDERRRLSLAGRIADVFDQYLLFRDDWLEAWERGQLLDLGPDEAWQALLWQMLTANGHPHRARLFGELIGRLQDDGELSGLPERLVVFGISSLPPHHLRVLQALARHCEVVLFALNPCREAWGEIRDLRELARDSSVAPDDWYLDVGHPLLASLGKQGRDFFDSLFALASEEGAEEIGVYASDADLRDDSLLQLIQNDILALRTRGPEERPLLRADDRSLELHVCHSPLREVEVLHDQLLARFAADPSLTPDQVVVLTPDIERYAPFIEAVFGGRGGAARTARIPYSLADRSLRTELPLIEAFLALLGLPDSRFAAEELLGLLERPALARRAGIEQEELPVLRDWLREAGVRWGRDEAHRGRLGLPEEVAFSWRQGLDRLLLGFVAPEQLAGDAPPLLGDCWPLDALEGARAQLLGRLAGFVAALGRWADELARPRPLAGWADCLQRLIDELFDEAEAGETLLLLSRACAGLREQAEAADIQRALPLELVRQQLVAALEQSGGASGFLTGAVTFCTMVPMRSLPFRWVCLLGLDDGALPRRTPAAGFDLIARHPRRGDRARRLDDRYLLLEILQSARDGLYLSHVGRDPRDNAVLPPSVLVSEILDCVDLSVRVEPTPANPQGLASRALSFLHPLQPFAPGNFDPARGGGFAAGWHGAARRLAQAPLAEAVPFAGMLEAPDDDWLRIEPGRLLQCFRHPARFLLEQRLALRLHSSEQSLAGDEPFALERAVQQRLRQLALQAAERGWSEDQERRVAAAAALLPVGELGQAYWGSLRGPIRAFAPRLFEERPQQAPQPLLVDVQLAGVHLHGWLDGVTEAGLFGHRLGRLGPWELAGFWLRHLLLNIAAGEGIARESRLLSPGGDWRLGPQADPRALLEPWLAAYREALSAPLPLFARASYGFAHKWRRPGRKEPVEAARSEARTQWLGNEFLPGEVLDPWNALAFRGVDPLDQRFERLAETLYGPALDALQGDEEDDA